MKREDAAVSTGYSSKTWACPFFGWDEKRKVHCEGGCCVSLPDQKGCMDYTSRYCANLQGWTACTVAAALLDYYERTDKP